MSHPIHVQEMTPPIMTDSAATDSASGSTEQLPIVSAPIPVVTEAAESAKATQATIMTNSTESAIATEPVESAKTTEATEVAKSEEFVETEKSMEVVHSVKPMESSEESQTFKLSERAPASKPDPQPVSGTDCSTEDTTPADEKRLAKDLDAQDAGARGKGGNSWMADLALDLDVAPDSKRCSTGAESEDDPEVVVVVPEMAAVGVSKSISVSGDGNVVRVLSPTILKKRQDNIRAEMNAFLEDSEAEDTVEAVSEKGKGVNEEGGKGNNGSGDSASASAADLLSVSVFFIRVFVISSLCFDVCI